MFSLELTLLRQWKEQYEAVAFVLAFASDGCEKAPLRGQQP
jgi:hypothetical protein